MPHAAPSPVPSPMLPPSYDPAAKLIALDTVERVMAAGKSFRAACAETGHPMASVHRWKAERAKGELEDARRTASGRKAAVALTEAEAARLKQLVMMKDGSFAMAIEFFAKDPACSPAVSEWIKGRLAASRNAPRGKARPPVWPESLRRLGHVTAEEWADWKGPKAAAGLAPVTRRTMDWVDSDGTRRRMQPHDVWAFDDYSTNQPYYLSYAAGQWRCCRQVLAGMDVYSNGWLGFLHVGKERDAYTAGDCCRVILDTIDAQGTMPRVILLEKGRWHGNALRGVELEEGGKRRWGSLEEAGFKVLYGFTSRHKAELESGFHPLQAWLGETGADIGRTRGEMERASNNMLAVNQGRRDPRHCGFLSLMDSAEAHFNAAVELNARPKDRQDLGYVSADQLFAEGTPAPRPLPEDKRWLFHPVKKFATISKGMLNSREGGLENTWVVNGVRDDVFLGDGHRVLVAFDPDQPHLGAVIANAETGTRNRDGWRLGEILLTAPALDAVPRIDLRAMEDRDGDERANWRNRQGAVKAAHHAFRAILPGGRAGMRTDRRKNRAGESVEITTGRPDTAAPANGPAPRFAGPREASDAPARCDDTPRRENAPQRAITHLSESEELEALAALEADL